MRMRLFDRTRPFWQRLEARCKRDSSPRETGKSHSQHAGHNSRRESVARVSGYARLAIDKALPTAADVHLLQVLTRERPALLQQFDHRFRKLRSRRPCLVYS